MHETMIVGLQAFLGIKFEVLINAKTVLPHSYWHIRIIAQLCLHCEYERVQKHITKWSKNGNRDQ